MDSIRTAAIAMVMGGAATLASAAPPSAPGILALGDSVPFGYIANDGPAYVNSNNFIGYPDYVGEDLRLGTTNAACPGESSVTFISSNLADPLGQFGCRAFHAKFPLHVSYTSTQLEFAKNFLTTHKQTRLVTISLGTNDVFGCLGNLACFEPQLSVNMAQILQGLRSTGFRGVIIVVNYYSLDYNDLAITNLVTSLNGTLATVAKANGAVVADVFAAFRNASSTTGQNPCKAGLLNGNPLDLTQTSCDIHPSQVGHQLIADTVAATFKAPSHGV
jgi:lysophospholipase L1-like esterase